jgi:hypothetical protein
MAAGDNPRFVVTNLPVEGFNPKTAVENGRR